MTLLLMSTPRGPLRSSSRPYFIEFAALLRTVIPFLYVSFVSRFVRFCEIAGIGFMPFGRCGLGLLYISLARGSCMQGAAACMARKPGVWGPRPREISVEDFAASISESLRHHTLLSVVVLPPHVLRRALCMWQNEY